VREREVLRLLPTLLSSAEIAGELFVSVNTVKTHVKSIYRKLEVSSRREAVARARQLRLM
jgi:LuxR family transcriptional regulator, maltose regulon positive regulatory protein